MREFAIIQNIFAPLARPRPEVQLGIGDDAALISCPAGQQWCWSLDTLVEGVHFAATDAPGDIGWKALAVNLSDLAAMGAQPVAALLGLTLPDGDADWTAAFAQGLGALADASGITLAGGDTTRGPRSITLSVLGTVPIGEALRRDGARIGDIIAVTGSLGDAALALKLGAAVPDALAARLRRPTPRIQAGLALRGLASAAIDLSDGLAADLGHVMRASGTAAAVRVDLLPASPGFSDAVADADALALQVGGGDDYELCCCLPPDRVADAVLALAAFDVPLTVVGRVMAGDGSVDLMRADGSEVSSLATGWEHFA